MALCPKISAWPCFHRALVGLIYEQELTLASGGPCINIDSLIKLFTLLAMTWLRWSELWLKLM